MARSRQSASHCLNLGDIFLCQYLNWRATLSMDTNGMPFGLGGLILAFGSPPRRHRWCPFAHLLTAGESGIIQ